MKVYTKTGDAGTTSLVGGKRVMKCSPRLEAYGTVDELNSHIGMLVALGVPEPASKDLEWIQNKLFDLGSLLATEPESKYQPRSLTSHDVERLEGAIDAMDPQLPTLRNFVLPGGTVSAAEANIARTVARRAERQMVKMNSDGLAIAPEAMRFINRLSDYLFVLARFINILAGNPEIYWNKDC